MKHAIQQTVFAGLLTLGLAAQALTLDGQTLNGALLDTSFSTASHVGIELSFVDDSPARLDYRLEAGDAGGSVSFNAILRAIGGTDFSSQLRLSLGNGAVFQVGSSYGLSGLDVAAGPDGAAVSLASAGLNEIYLGDPFAEGRSDWRISFGSLQAGEGFSLTVSQVPEASTTAMLAVGLLSLGLLARRRRS